MHQGENLQRLVRILERATNDLSSVQVESPKRLRDRDTGRLREHDVVLTFKLNHHVMIVALECRDRSRKVGVPEIEAFKKKCDRTGVHKGIIVSSVGFAHTALKKAEAMEIGCFGLEEVERFNWCQAPGIEHRLYDIMDGPAWGINTATPFDGSPILYSGGKSLDADAFTNLAHQCLKGRAPEIAQQEDEAARYQPVTCTFDNLAAPSFYLIDNAGRRVPLTRMVINVRYRIRSSLIPLNFREYIDHSQGRRLYSAAFASIDEGNPSGDLIMQRQEDGKVTIIFVPKSA